MVSKTGAQRPKDYSDNNGQAVKLTKLRYSVRLAGSGNLILHLMRITERKRKYRARKTAEKIDGRENAALSDASESAADDVAPENDSLVQASKKSRQVLVGLLQRKKANKEKNNSINSLMVEHREMEKEMHNMDESILEA